MNIIKRISETEYVRSAIEDKADLSAFKEKPSLRVILGVSAIGFSYIIGWPAIGALAALAALSFAKRSLIVIKVKIPNKNKLRAQPLTHNPLIVVT